MRRQCRVVLSVEPLLVVCSDSEGCLVHRQAAVGVGDRVVTGIEAATAGGTGDDGIGTGSNAGGSGGASAGFGDAADGLVVLQTT